MFIFEKKIKAVARIHDKIKKGLTLTHFILSYPRRVVHIFIEQREYFRLELLNASITYTHYYSDGHMLN